jgi:DNA-binding LytR/AlgR family response regulator
MRVLVVDDEAPARSELLHLLGAHDGIQAGEAAGAAEALVAAREVYDAIFLDIQMPGLTGLDVAALVRAAPAPPAIVFVTAHAEYAVEAFAIEAFDYLLKPVDPERLARVVERLRERGGEEEPPPRRIPVVAAGGGTELIDIDQVHYAQADGDYCRVHTYDRSYLATVSLGELEESLPPQRFTRIHRSHLVNLGKVAAIKRAGNDRMRLVLDDAARTELDVARRQSRRVRELLRL